MTTRGRYAAIIAALVFMVAAACSSGPSRIETAHETCQPEGEGRGDR